MTAIAKPRSAQVPPLSGTTALAPEAYSSASRDKPAENLADSEPWDESIRCIISCTESYNTAELPSKGVLK
ncbi:hypothetical protein TMatcc_003824 [Talaromyces marneffei ATCC 18224]